MHDSWITGLASVTLDVSDLARSRRFYTEAWGLKEVDADARWGAFCCPNDEAVVLRLRQAAAPGFHSLSLLARDATAVNALHERATGAAAAKVLAAPGVLPDEEGGGYGLILEGPEKLRAVVAVGSPRRQPMPAPSSHPLSLTHVVLNTADMAASHAFFTSVLGFRLSDRTDRMEFLRCGTDHHTVALAHGSSLSLNHAAFDMRNIDSLMYGAGRMIENGHAIEWGPGRHGPGNNVFCYFVDPDGFAIEYTTDMEQVDDSYRAHDAVYWSSFPRRPCRWGVARKPSVRLMAAMGGQLDVAAQSVATDPQAQETR